VRFYYVIRDECVGQNCPKGRSYPNYRELLKYHYTDEMDFNVRQRSEHVISCNDGNVNIIHTSWDHKLNKELVLSEEDITMLLMSAIEF
jgi:hypothetical protein